jgi:L-threonylcarbamoyladenylate synthase
MQPVLPTPEILDKASELLRNDALVAFPTETVYGLGANALSEKAVLKIFVAKGRPSDNPLIVHVDCLDSARKYVREIDPVSESLAEAFWPGPLTIVLPLKPDCGIAESVSAGLDTVGIRVPNHHVALSLLKASQLPLAAPSSNKSGSPSPTTALHVSNDLIDETRPSMIIDGGPCKVGLESTVVQVRDRIIHILRPGGVSADDISTKIGVNKASIVFGAGSDDVAAPRAPGMKYRHYAPNAVVVAVSEWSAIVPNEGDTLVIFDSNRERLKRGSQEYRVMSFGKDPGDVETASARLFDLLRRSDDIKSRRVLIDSTFDKHIGIGPALWNRISKAASRI